MRRENYKDEGGRERHTLLPEVPKIVYNREKGGEMEEEKDIELLESEREDNRESTEEKGDCGD